MSWWWKRTWARQRKRAPAGPLTTLLEHPWPLPSSDALVAPLLALDLETTSLHPEQGHIVSIAWAPVDSGRIELSRAQHRWVRTPKDTLTAHSVTIHGVGHDRAERGEELASAIEALLAAMAGRLVVAHHATLDMGFLSEACRRLYGCGLRWPGIDTLDLMRRQLQRKSAPLAPSSLRLGSARTQLGLPWYPVHDALWDAIACAELWLALAADWSSGKPMALRRVAQLFP